MVDPLPVVGRGWPRSTPDAPADVETVGAVGERMLDAIETVIDGKLERDLARRGLELQQVEDAAQHLLEIDGGIRPGVFVLLDA